MKVIKHQEKDVDEVIRKTNHRKIDRDTAFFLNGTVNLGLEYVEKEGDIDMCTSMDRKYKEKEVTGAIKILQSSGTADNEIMKQITETFSVTKEYVLELLSLQKV